MPVFQRLYLLKAIKRWNWALWLQWVLVNTASWVIAFLAISKISNLIPNLFVRLPLAISKSAAMAPLGILFGSVVGLAQFFVLRRKLPISGRWVLTSAIACGFIWGLPWSSMDPILQKILIGLLLGLAQWLVLRKRFRGHSWWIIVSGLSWIAGESFAQWFIQHNLFSLFSNYKEFIRAGFHGLIYGIFSGFGIIYLYYYTTQRGKTLRLRNIAPPRKEIFVVSWIVMNAIGWTIGFGRVGQALQDFMLIRTGLPSHMILEKVPLECIAALFVWFVLWRQWFRGSFWWVIWTGIGVAAGIFVWTALSLENATGIVVYGVIVGFFQWFVLSQKVQGFMLWMIIRTIGWAGSLVVVSHVGRRIHSDVGWGIGGLTYGMLTGAFLFWRLRQRKR